MSSAAPPFSVYETKTGINWKYAGQGMLYLAAMAIIMC